ncbi:MAG: polyribonucleotide nucleotidyltransferase, partial [bacterium]
MGESISINVGGRAIRIGTGEIARQAGGAALVQYGETVILATAVLGNPRAQGGDFLPLTVDYRERTYAAGRIPGGFFKRETRPREKETMTSRLTDRTVRPLFAEYIRHEIQV